MFDHALETLPRERLRELQWRKLKALAEGVLAPGGGNPFLRHKWAAAGLRTAADLRAWDDFARLPFTAKAVAWIRHHYQIRKPGSDRQVAAGTSARADGRYSTRALATRLGVSIATIHYWRVQGILPAVQELPGGPWWHEITPEGLERLRRHIRRAPVQPTAFDPQHFLVEGAL